ncbi:Gfo/Idh/MocA family protein [Candidatus Hydrogenedentota bacterium]
MSYSKKVRIGFVGVGNMGQCAHLKNYATIDECEVVAIAELRSDLRKKVSQRYGVGKTYENHSDMLASEELDAIVASQAFNHHGLLLPELLATGKPVFSEKPIAASIEVGEKIVQAEKDGGSFLMVGYHKRSDPATMYAKEKIEELRASGELGALTYVRIVMPAGDWIAGGFNDMIKSSESIPGTEIDPPPSDMTEDEHKRYISFVNYYIHQVNLMRHMLGTPYHVKYVDPSEVILAVEGENGVPGVIEMTPYSTTIDWQEEILVCFERGYVKLTLPAPVALNRPGKVEILHDPKKGETPETVAPQLPWVHAMRQQAMNFISAVRGDSQPLCTAEEALEDLKNAREYYSILLGN